MSATVTAENIQDRAVFLTLDVHKWSGSAKADSNSVIRDDLDKTQVWAVQHLIGDKTALDNLTAHYEKTKRWVGTKDVPFDARKGLYLIPEQVVEEVNDYLKQAKKEYLELVQIFLDDYESLRDQFQVDNPQLFRPEKYPAKEVLAEKFSFRWFFRQYSVPGNISPALQKEELRKFKEEVAELKEATKNAIASEIVNRIDSLTGQFEGGKINAATLRGINEFLEKVDTVFTGFFTQRQLESALADVRTYLEDVEAEDLRASEELQGMVDRGLRQVVKTIEKIPDVKLKRAVDIDG